MNARRTPLDDQITRLELLLNDCPQGAQADVWRAELDQLRGEREKRKQPPRCPACDEMKSHAYSDATTPGFFYTACEKHRTLKGATA